MLNHMRIFITSEKSKSADPDLCCKICGFANGELSDIPCSHQSPKKIEWQRILILYSVLYILGEINRSVHKTLFYTIRGEYKKQYIR